MDDSDWERLRKEGLLFLHGVDRNYHPILMFRAFELRPKEWKMEHFTHNLLALFKRLNSITD